MACSKISALITGGSRGFGKEFVKRLVSKGGKVAILDIDKEAGQTLAVDCQKKYGENSARFIHCNVADIKQLKDAFHASNTELGGVNLICNNAGTARGFSRKQQNFDTVSSMVALNLTAVINGTHLGVQIMSPQNGGNGGQIINIASMGGLVPMAISPEYAATKHGVVGFTRSLNEVFAQDKIRVNCLCPEFVATDLVTDAMESVASFKKLIEHHGLMPIEKVADAFYDLVLDETKDGTCTVVSQSLGRRNVRLAIKFLD